MTGNGKFGSKKAKKISKITLIFPYICPPLAGEFLSNIAPWFFFCSTFFCGEYRTTTVRY
jgi:hypothetical protein